MAEHSSAKSILFVCTGNSCRSVMAEYYLKHLLNRAGVQALDVGSAGIFAIEGMQPTRETLRVLQEAGVPSGDHRARILTAELIEEADLIFAMEPFQVDEILRRLPIAEDKVFLLKTYGLEQNTQPSSRSGGISDPIGKPLEVYEVCFQDIREAVDRIARSLGIVAG